MHRTRQDKRAGRHGPFRYSPLDTIHVVLTLTMVLAPWLAAAAWHEQAHGITRTITGAGFVLGAALLGSIAQHGQHYHTHTPFFVSKRLNSFLNLLQSVAFQQPAAVYRYFHLAHHKVTISYSTFSLFEVSGLWGKTLWRRVAFTVLDPLNLFFLVMSVKTLYTKAAARPARPPEFKTFDAYVEYGAAGFLAKAGAQPAIAHKVLIQAIAIAGYRAALLALSPSFFFFVFLPLQFLTTTIHRYQEFCEHFGVDASNPATNSVSCYGRLYNAITFNNGYHQEHHMRPAVHWTKIAALKKEMAPAQKRRVVPFSHMTNPFVPLGKG
jgi:fatty acid desaturase